MYNILLKGACILTGYLFFNTIKNSKKKLNNRKKKQLKKNKKETDNG